MAGTRAIPNSVEKNCESLRVLLPRFSCRFCNLYVCDCFDLITLFIYLASFPTNDAIGNLRQLATPTQSSTFLRRWFLGSFIWGVGGVGLRCRSPFALSPSVSVSPLVSLSSSNIGYAVSCICSRRDKMEINLMDAIFIDIICLREVNLINTKNVDGRQGSTKEGAKPKFGVDSGVMTSS